MTEPASGIIEGRLDPERPIQTHLARALLPLVRGKRTGAMRLTIGGARPTRMQIVIADGQIVFAEADADASLLLERLVEQGALGSTQAMRIERRLLDERSWSGMVTASELAVAEAQVPPNVAMQAIAETVRARVTSALRALEGEWAYRDDARAASVPRYPVPFEKTVLEALAHPDCAPRLEERLGRYARHYPRLEGDSKENTTLFGMTPARFRTLRLLDGAHALTEVLAQSPMGATEAAAMIAGLTMFERIWWNATPSPKAPTGTIPAQRAAPAPRPLTIERAPPSIEELRSLVGAPPPSTPAGRAPSQIRMPTPSPVRPPSSPGRPPATAIPSPAIISELLRRGGGGARSPDTRGPTGQAGPTSTPTPAIAAPDTLSARGHFDRGKTHLAGGRIAPAHTDFARALELEPDNGRYRLHERFAAYLQSANASERTALDKEIHALAMARAREDEADAFAYHVLGRLAFDQGDDERARKAFKMAERNDPKDVETLRYQRILAGRKKK